MDCLQVALIRVGIDFPQEGKEPSFNKGLGRALDSHANSASLGKLTE